VSSIVLSAAGSLGEVLPFVAIGGAHRHRGHTVRFLLPSEFHPMVRAAGFDVAPAGFEISSSTWRRSTSTGPGPEAWR
jgi:UDP:flavonoid glycosyltransferase YjiC (YdhE family)